MPGPGPALSPGKGGLSLHRWMEDSVVRNAWPLAAEHIWDTRAWGRHLASFSLLGDPTVPGAECSRSLLFTCLPSPTRSRLSSSISVVLEFMKLFIIFMLIVTFYNLIKFFFCSDYSQLNIFTAFLWADVFFQVSQNEV